MASAAGLPASFRLDGRVAVVVGGTGALGSRMAATLAAAGARTVVVGRDQERGERVAESLRADGGDASSCLVTRPAGPSSARSSKRVLGSHGSGRRPRERRRRELGNAVPGDRRRRAGAARRPQPAGGDACLPGVRPVLRRTGDRVRRGGEHHQRRQRGGSHPTLAGVHLLDDEGGRAQPDPEPGPRVGPARDPLQRARPRVLPLGAEPGDPRRRAGRPRSWPTPRSGASATPTTSRARRSCSRATPDGSSPVPRSSSTAASPPARSERIGTWTTASCTTTSCSRARRPARSSTSVAERAADRRPPQPPAARGHRRDRVFETLDRALARGRPLQVARDAPRRRRRAADHRRRRPVGAVRRVGGDRPRARPQPALRLDAPRAAPGVRDRRPARPGTAREIWDEANRLLPDLSGADAARALRRDDDRDDRRPRRRPRRAPAAARRRRRADDDPDLPPRRRAPRCSTTRPPGTRGPTGCSRAGAVEDLESLLAALDRRPRALRRRSAPARATTASPACRTPTATRRLADAAVRRARSGQTPRRRRAGRRRCSRSSRSPPASPPTSDGVLQLHLGARRNLSPRILEPLGHDAGADAVGDQRQGPGLVRFLGGLERDGTAAPHRPLQRQPRRRHAVRDDRGRLLAGRASRRSCSGARRGGSTTTRTGCAASSTTCRGPAGSPASSGWSPTRARCSR